jgi:hypothetical protein
MRKIPRLCDLINDALTMPLGQIIPLYSPIGLESKAGIDIGSESHFVCVPAGRGEHSVN